MLTDFSYCVSMNEGLPCRNIVSCFNGRIDIVAFLKERFTEDELKKAFGGLPKSRIERIIESVNSDS
ncbi:MAG TPA: hypothetical protein VEF37_05010 [Thermodesulfovibrionales bacterium]|nr:hypothetical protein [Thermodesulfovibrionales bacterium]